jgi:hypothetical protein
MTTEHRPRPSVPTTGATPAHELKRIPLPPLPHFRKTGAAAQATPAPSPMVSSAVSSSVSTDTSTEAPAGAISHLEMSELLGPRHEGGIEAVIEPASPPRTGATGATILNDLVDEIEKGLEKELARTAMSATTQVYRRVVACAVGPERRTEP